MFTVIVLHCIISYYTKFIIIIQNQWHQLDGSLTLRACIYPTELCHVNGVGTTTEQGTDGSIHVTLGCTAAPETGDAGPRGQSEPVRQQNDEHCSTVAGPELAGQSSYTVITKHCFHFIG